MSTVIERRPTETTAEQVPIGLFVVWIDCNCGIEVLGPDWEMNSEHLCPAKPLQDALDEAAECQAHGYPTKIMPEGQTPRPDGLFSNPHTDP